MKMPLKGITLLAALPALALAQTSNPPALRYENPVDEETTGQIDSAAMSLRSGHRPVQIGSWPVLPEREVREWKVTLQPAPPPLASGEGDFKLGGPLVDAFRLKPRVANGRSLGRRILDLPIISLLVPQPLTKPGRQGPYLAWGERDAPWMAVCDRHHDDQRGVLFSMR